MTSCKLGGTSYRLSRDHESRLTNVTGGTTNETYTYDGDGARVKVVNGNTTTVYIGNYYEYTIIGGTLPPTISTRSYYYAGTKRLAVRDSATGVAYLYGDHLGSASVAVSGSGAVLSRTRYKPWGEQRGQSGSPFPTDRLFTGQIWDGAESAGGTGLYFYNARYYDPALGRFTQADTIVPEPGNPMAFDRYAYTLNNPVRYVDPSGHCGLDTGEGADKRYADCDYIRTWLMDTYGILIDGRWMLQEMQWLREALGAASDFVGGVTQLTTLFSDALRNHGSAASKLTFLRELKPRVGGGWLPSSGTIRFGNASFVPGNWTNYFRPAELGMNERGPSARASILHEIGHVILDARPDVVAKYRVARQWYDDVNGPQDGRPTINGGINVHEELAQAMMLTIEGRPRSSHVVYQKYSFQINFVRLYFGHNYYRWYRSTPLPQ